MKRVITIAAVLSLVSSVFLSFRSGGFYEPPSVLVSPRTTESDNYDRYMRMIRDDPKFAELVIQNRDRGAPIDQDFVEEALECLSEHPDNALDSTTGIQPQEPACQGTHTVASN